MELNSMIIKKGWKRISALHVKFLILLEGLIRLACVLGVFLTGLGSFNFGSLNLGRFSLGSFNFGNFGFGSFSLGSLGLGSFIGLGGRIMKDLSMGVDTSTGLREELGPLKITSGSASILGWAKGVAASSVG